jgi:hypothetical protein
MGRAMALRDLGRLVTADEAFAGYQASLARAGDSDDL